MNLRGFIFLALILPAWPSAAQPTPVAPPAAYVLRAGDALHLEVAGEPKSAQDVKIGAEGTVKLAGLAQPLTLAGLDMGAAALVVARAYIAANVYPNPLVSLTVTEFARQPAATAAAASPPTSIYKLRPTDVIHVSVAGDAAATIDYRINVDGTVTVAHLNHPFKLVGLTVAEAAKLIRQAYLDEKISPNPVITVEVKEFATRRINVLGAVVKPGQIQIPAQQALTLVAAIAAAGGPTQRAATFVTITRVLPDGTTQKLENVDLKGAVKDASKDIPLQDGDAIFLGESMLGSAR